MDKTKFVTKQEIIRDMKQINKCIDILESLREKDKYWDSNMFTRMEYFYTYGKDIVKAIDSLRVVESMLGETYEERYKEKS